MVENIDNLIEYLNHVKKQYTEGFIPHEDKEFRFKLNEFMVIKKKADIINRIRKQ
jgi:hypothetical protein